MIDRELGDVAAELVEPLHRPRRHVAHQQALRDAVAVLQHAAHGGRIEQAERALEDRADAVVGGQHVDGALLHQVLEPLGDRGLAAADGTEQIEDLLLLLQALRGVAEEADDALDRLLETVEVLEGRIDLQGPVHEDAAEPRVLRRVDEFRLADRGDHALRGAGVHGRVGAASFEILSQGHPMLLLTLVCLGIEVEDVVVLRHSSSPLQSAARHRQIRPREIGENRCVAGLFASNPVTIWPIRHASIPSWQDGDRVARKQSLPALLSGRRRARSW